MREGKQSAQVRPLNKMHDESFFSATGNQVTVFQQDMQADNSNLNCKKIPTLGISSKAQKLLESNYTTIFMTVVTIYALFASDIKTLGFSNSADDVFSSLTVVCLFFFLLELVLLFIFQPKYRWSFYFWLDLIATLSLITDIGWIWDSLIGNSNSSSSGKQLQNAAKASRVGTRTSRVLRIIRLIRLIRLVKLYKNAQTALKKKQEENDEEIEVIDDISNAQTESKIGKKLSETVMKRVIIIILIMLFLLPFFEYDFYFTAQTSWDFGIYELQNFLNQDGFSTVLDEYVSYHENDIRPLVYLSYVNESGSYEWEGSSGYSYLRYDEIYYFSYNDFISIFDTRYDAKLTSLLNIFKTIYISIMLTLAAIYFTKDTENLIITPLDKITTKVKKIASNPISASEIKTLDDVAPINSKSCFCFKKNDEKNENYETQIIENTMVKIGVLLALGFGEAGARIIGSNIEKAGEVDPMISGNKVVAIFGFCDIRNFTDTTEELQEGVMMFVNEIAQIVHGLVEKYFGAANKNIGDAFLLVWKFEPEDFSLENDVITRNASSKRAVYVPDMSLMSFLKILAKVNKDPGMLKYRSNPKLLQRMPNYEVKMGFGMHLGWAIEGAIGSRFKVDASYLSPHVNLASALEGSTKIYGVPILISGSLYNNFSAPIQNYCRQIDVVNIKGVTDPVLLYTSDCDFTNFLTCRSRNRNKKYYTKKKKLLKKKFGNDEITPEQVFSSSKEINMMRRDFSSEFFSVFNKGLQNYVNGEWSAAKHTLEKTLELRPKDGPTLALLNYMSEFGYSAPESWKKVRYLG